MASIPNPIMKTRISLKHKLQWPHGNGGFICRRFTQLPLLLLPDHHLPLLSHPLPIHRRFHLLPPSLPRPIRRSLHPLLPAMSSLSSPHEANHNNNNNDDVNPTSKTVRAVIKGRVQGVFYRNWTIENAQQLGLKGWVRNRRDGSVEALFSGSPEKVQEMEQRCRRGPPHAMVTGLQVFPSTDDPGTTFERRPTV